MTAPETATAASQAAQSRQLIGLLNQKIDLLTSPVGQAQTQHAIAWYDYQRSLMKYDQSLLAWQLLASNVLLWVVVIVTVAGVAYSGIQLATAARTGRQRDTTLEISAQKLRVTSSVVGIVVLAISFAFLLIFVQQVYQIRAMDLQSRSSTAAEPATKPP
jgi:hypothetical protein